MRRRPRPPGHVRLTADIAIVGSGEFGLSGPLDCHCYLVRTGDRGGVLVDSGAGPDAEMISANLADAGVLAGRLHAILLTHAHADHAGGAAALSARWDAPVYASPPEATLLRQGSDEELGLVAAKLNGTYPDDYRYHHLDRVEPVNDGTQLVFGTAHITALTVPGHTAGSTAWLVEVSGYRALFTGDAVFAGGLVSVLNLPGSDAAAYRASLPRLADTVADGLYPGHGAFAVFDGMRHVRLAARRLRGSVIPNYAVPRWSPPAWVDEENEVEAR